MIQQLRPGATLEDVYINTYKFVKDTFPELTGYLQAILGYGIGAMSCLESLTIARGNMHKVKVGECYLISTYMNNVPA